MAATTISRNTWTDGASGTVLSNAVLQGHIYDKIDAVIAADVTFGGLITTEGFGTHLFSAGGTGANRIRVRNTSAGTTMSAIVEVGNNATAALGELMALSSTFTTDAANGLHASGVTLRGNGSGGLNVVCTAGPVRFHASSNLRVSIDTTHGLVAENGYGIKIKNTGGNQIDGVVLTSGNQLNIGSDNASNVSDTQISAGGSIRFRMNSAERIVMTAAGALQVGDGSVGAPSLAFLSDTDTGIRNGSGGDVVLVGSGADCMRVGPLGASVYGRNFGVNSGAWGTGALGSGSFVGVGRNTSGTGAAGYVRFTLKGGSNVNMWIDNVGTVRVGVAPTEDESSSDTGGTIVGTQTSSRSFKRDITPYLENVNALDTIRRAPLFRFRYREGHGVQGEEFVGIITDESPIFGMDRDVEHPGGKSLNVVTAIGYLIASVQVLADRVEALEA